MSTADTNDSMTDTLSAINIEQLTSSAMGAFGHNTIGLFGPNEQTSVLPAAASSACVVTSLSQTIPLMVSLGNGDKQISSQGTLPPLKSLIPKQKGVHSVRHLISPVSPSLINSTTQPHDSVAEASNIKSVREPLAEDKSVLSGVFPPDVSTSNCHQTSALLSQLASLVQGTAQANQLEVAGLDSTEQLEGIDSNFLQNSTASTDIQIANLQSLINLILTNPSLQNSTTCQALLNILNQSSSDSAPSTDIISGSQTVDISQLLNGEVSVQTSQSSSESPSILPSVPTPSQSTGSTHALASIVPSIPSSLPGISTLSIQSTSVPSSVITDSSHSQPIDASQVTYIRQLINSQVLYPDPSSQTANQMISVKQDPSLSSAQSLISSDHLEQFYTVTTSADTMTVENLLQSTSNTQVAVATMNYQDLLTSYLQSSADNEDVTLPSNLTMDNINAAIQSEDPKGKKSQAQSLVLPDTDTAGFIVEYCVLCDGSKCSCPTPGEYSHVADRVIPSRARLSMPSCLEIRLSKSSLSSQVPESVYALKSLVPHTKFGPLIGEEVKTLDTEGQFPEWRVMEDSGCHYISTVNEELSNWLRFIRPAQNIVEQNLVVHQVGQSLYFFVKRDIKQGEELLFWFSKEYAVICGYSVIPKPSSVNECPVCAAMFRKRQALRNHLAEVHRDVICSQPEESDLLDPTKSKSKKKGDPLELVTCSFCKKVLASNSNLKKHMAVHKGERNFKCDHCQKSFRQKAHLESHMGIHNKEKIRCTYCDRTFNRDTDRKLHEKTHTKTGLFQCESCKKTFTKKQNYKRHILIHTGQKNFHCEYCNKDYYTKYHLQRHKEKCRGADKFPVYIQMEDVYNGPGEALGIDKNTAL